jgi:hypothetical protein
LAEVARILRPGGQLCASIVHPFFSAGWVPLPDRTGSTRPYFTETSYTETVGDAGHQVILHSRHRPLQAYVDALRRADLALERLSEPRPSAAYLAAHPEAKALDSAPLYLHFTARRAG